MVSVSKRNLRPPIQIPVLAPLQELVEWRHPLLRGRREPTAGERLLAAWRKNPGYRFFFDRKDIGKAIREVPASDFRVYQRTLSYFQKGPDGKYGPGEGAGAVPPRSQGLLIWDFYTPRNQELGPAVNRFGWIVGMAIAARRSGRTKDAETVLGVMDDWLAQNPVPVELIEGKKGVWPYWYRPWAPFNVAMRCKTWVPVLHLLWDSPALTGERFGRYLQAIRQHVLYLGRVSTKLDPKAKGNHFLIEMEGMLCGSLFPWLKERKVFWKAAIQNLLRCVDRQVLPDGVHCEVAPGYHRACMCWFNQPLLLARLNGTKIPKSLVLRTLGMLEFGLHGVAPDGLQFCIADTGKHGDGWLPERFVARCAGRKLPFPMPPAQGFLPFLRNMLSVNGRQEKFSPVRYFPQGGFAAARSSWKPDASAILIKLGSYGGGHSHADFLSFLLALKGRTLIDERGTWAYNNDLKSIACKLSPAHNVLLLGQREMFDPGDPGQYFCGRRGPRVEVKDVFFEEKRGGLIRTGGRVVFPDGTWWRREFSFDPAGRLRILDDVKNRALEGVRIQFYIASASAKADPGGWISTHDSGLPNLRLRCQGSPNLRTALLPAAICAGGFQETPARLAAFDSPPTRQGRWETVIELA